VGITVNMIKTRSLAVKTRYVGCDHPKVTQMQKDADLVIRLDPWRKL
jgi:hypothetical protein